MLSEAKLDSLKKRTDLIGRKVVCRKLKMGYETLTKKLGGFRDFRGSELAQLEAVLDSFTKIA